MNTLQQHMVINDITLVQYIPLNSIEELHKL